VAELGFCACRHQHRPLDILRQRWSDAERLGLEVVWNCDTVVEPDRPRHFMFDGPTTLTMMAAETASIYSPQSWRQDPGEDAVFEEVAATLIPQLRASRSSSGA
jgi:hypothetical protein